MTETENRYSKFGALLFLFFLCGFFCAETSFCATKLEEIARVTFYMKNGRILKSEVLEEHPTTVRILSRGEEMVIRKDAIQFAYDSSGTEVGVEIGEEKKETAEKIEPIPEKKAVEKKPEPAVNSKPVEAPSDENEDQPVYEKSVLPGMLDSLEEPDDSQEEPVKENAPVDGKTNVVVEMNNGELYEGVIQKENNKCYYLHSGEEKHKLKKDDVKKVMEIDHVLESEASDRLKIDFYMKDKTTVRGVVIEEKPAVFIIDADGEEKEVQKKDVTFALDEEGKDFKINIDAALLKELEEEERISKEEEARRARLAREKREKEEKIRNQKEEKQRQVEKDYNEGLNHMMKKDYESAVSCFVRVIRSEPDFGEALYRLGFAYYQLGEDGLAVKSFEKAKSLGLAKADAMISEIARAQEKRKREARIKKVLLWSGIGSGTALILFFTALIILKARKHEFESEELGPPEEAAESSQPPQQNELQTPSKIISAFEKTKIAEQGFIADEETMKPESVQEEIQPISEPEPALEEVMKTEIPSAGEEQRFSPEKAERCYIKAGDLCNRGSLTEAKIEYENAIRYNPRLDVAYIGLGYVLLSQGKIREAIQEYIKSLDINPNQSEAHYSLGVAYFNVGDISQARYEWKKALLINPNFKEAKECLEAAR